MSRENENKLEDRMKRNLLLITKATSLKDGCLYSAAYSLVSSHRKNTVDRYLHLKDKYLSLAAEVLLNYGFRLLGEEIDLEEIKYGSKPYIEGKYHFNFSHSGEYTICAISKDETGCDIEKKDAANLKIAKRFFHENEYRKIAAESDKEKQNELFFDFWTAKEAFAKTLGTGISTPLGSFEIVFDDRIRVKQNINTDKYYFRKFGIDGYALCTCCRNDEEFEFINIDIRDIL